jgi:hypothetical protein
MGPSRACRHQTRNRFVHVRVTSESRGYSRPGVLKLARPSGKIGEEPVHLLPQSAESRSD